jgi:hypothetical protein
MPKAHLTWKDPTTRSDASATPLKPGDLAYILVQMSADNGQNYADVGHAAPGQQSFDQDLTDPGTYLFKLDAVDTQTPPMTSADSIVVSVTVPVPSLAAPNPPTDVTAVLNP